MRISARGYNAASLDSTWRACHIASADSREAITMRCGASVLAGSSNMLLAKFFRRALIGAILALPVLPAFAQERLAYANDLAATAAEAGRRRVPVMLVFTDASCPYCTRAKRDYLVPLQSRGPLADKVIVLEVDVVGSRPLRDFEGRITTHREYAQREQVRIVPTVLVTGTRGEPLGAPIVGLLAPDFYQLYLERAIEDGLLKLRATEQ